MARRFIEALTGVGDIYAGDILLRAGATYHLSLWSDDDGAQRNSDPPIAVTIEGNVSITGIAEAVVLAGPDNLTLKLQDGRRLAFLLKNTGGEIVGRSGLQPA
jgi:hypothetical protein